MLNSKNDKISPKPLGNAALVLFGAGKFQITRTLQTGTLTSERFTDPHQKSKGQHSKTKPTFAGQSCGLEMMCENLPCTRFVP